MCSCTRSAIISVSRTRTWRRSKRAPTTSTLRRRLRSACAVEPPRAAILKFVSWQLVFAPPLGIAEAGGAMSAAHVLVSLFGGVALLLWGIQMISMGVQRALGSNLRHFLAIGLRNRWRAFATGVAVTGLLQSSTATALMVSTFTAGGAVDLVPALAVMLGANVGTTLIVQLVSFDISFVY